MSHGSFAAGFAVPEAQKNAAIQVLNELPERVRSKVEFYDENEEPV